MRCTAVVPLVLLAGCTHFEALTPAPPGQTASLNSRNDELVLSRGVALAMTCTAAGGEPCAREAATVDDPEIAKVYPAHLDTLQWFWEGSFSPTSYVVVGLRPGETILRIPGEDPLRVVVQE